MRDVFPILAALAACLTTTVPATGSDEYCRQPDRITNLGGVAYVLEWNVDAGEIVGRVDVAFEGNGHPGFQWEGDCPILGTQPAGGVSLLGDTSICQYSTNPCTDIF